MSSLSYLALAQVAVRVLPAAACAPILPTCWGGRPGSRSEPGRVGAISSWLIRLVSRIRPKQLDLRARLFEILERRFSRCRVSIYGEVQVEAVVEGLTEHRPAVQPGQVDIATGKAIEGMRQAARPVRRDECERGLPPSLGIPRTSRCAPFHHHKAGPVFGVVLDRLGQHV